MNNSDNTYQVVIVGGGPVGLFLGLCLHHAGVSCLILEKRTEIRKGSRSLGIHPVSLELFGQLGISGAFTGKGVKIRRGHAYTNDKKLGTLSFAENCPKPFNYILALPQYITETILQQHISSTDDRLLVRGARVTDISQNEKQVSVSYFCDGETNQITASFLVGCDGKDSFVRTQAGISFEGTSYPDTYIMGDFPDNTSLGTDAAIFLCEEGLIESFPLPNRKRRWVVKTKTYQSEVRKTDIAKKVSTRIDHNLDGIEAEMLSSFGVQKLLADPIVKGRIILAGDAAHIVSPIGGQGMNLGWLGAWDLSQRFTQVFHHDKPYYAILNTFEKQRKKAARTASRRAELNMRLGREPKLPFLRDCIVSLMLKNPLSKLMAQTFTMRGINSWIV